MYTDQMFTVDEIVEAVIALGQPIEGPFAVWLWEQTSSQHRWPIEFAKEVMNKCGYEIWEGYPLKRRRRLDMPIEEFGVERFEKIMMENRVINQPRFDKS